MQQEATQTYLGFLKQFLNYHLEQYTNEGRPNVSIGIGCTGGKHRSVVLAEHFGNLLKLDEYIVHITHRDINKE